MSCRRRANAVEWVGYQGETLIFNGFPLDASGQPVQGVPFSWESSDTSTLRIDDTGQATLLQPGRVNVTSRAGIAQGSAVVEIRPGARPPQTDAEWDADQNSLVVTGQQIGSAQGSEASRVLDDDSDGSPPSSNIVEQIGPDGSESSGSIVERIAEGLAPTAEAQGGCTYCGTTGDSTDFGYDELWNETRNLVGNPHNRAIEAFGAGSVLPEGSNFNMGFPLYALGGRGLSAGVDLNYNGRIWSRHGSAVTFNAVNSWPFAGFSLGFGRIFTYGSGANTKYVWIANGCACVHAAN